MRVESWADLVCPWCSIGKRRLGRALGRFAHRDAVEVVHRACWLDTSAPRGRTERTPDRLTRTHGTLVAQAAEVFAQALGRAWAERRPLPPLGAAASPGRWAPGGANDVSGSEGSCAVPGEPAQAEGRNR